MLPNPQLTIDTQSSSRATKVQVGNRACTAVLNVPKTNMSTVTTGEGISCSQAGRYGCRTNCRYGTSSYSSRSTRQDVVTSATRDNVPARPAAPLMTSKLLPPLAFTPVVVAFAMASMVVPQGYRHQLPVGRGMACGDHDAVAVVSVKQT